MRYLTLSLLGLLLLSATAPAAPAPLVKPDRKENRPMFEYVVRELREHHVLVREVVQKAPCVYAVTFIQFSYEGCGTLALRRTRQVEARDRVAALGVLLGDARKQTERRLAELRAARAIE